MFPAEQGDPLSPLIPGTKEQLEEFLPDLAKVGVDVVPDNLYDLEGRQVPAIDSSSITSDHWKFMAAAIERQYEEYDGFVILHGTDTMAYTTSALSFMLMNLGKPVVVTGSQLPIADPRTDAVSNYVNSVFLAGWAATGLPRIPEVVLCFADLVLRGNRVRKMSTNSWQGFDTPNCPHLARIGEYIEVDESVILEVPESTQRFFARLDLDQSIADVSLFPGIRPEMLEAVLLRPGLKGAIIRTYGAGNAPSRAHNYSELGQRDLLDVIDEAVGRGVVVVNVTQCPQGMVEAGLYEASSGLLERGVLSGLDMTPEAALTKLMSLLANEPLDVKSLVQIDLRGEQTRSLFEIRFDPSDGQAGDTSAEATIVTSRPAGGLDASRIRTAALRVRNLRIEGVDRATVRVFLNHPNASRSTSLQDRRYSNEFVADAGDSRTQIADVSDVARAVIEGSGRSVSVSFVPSEGGRVLFDSLTLALFTK